MRTRRNNKRLGKHERITHSRRQRGGDTDRLLSDIRDEKRELEDFKREKQRLIKEKEDKEKEVITARLVTEKAKKKDGKDLVPRAKRDSATEVSGFLRMTQEELDKYNYEIASLTEQIEASENYIDSLYEEYYTEKLVEGVEEGEKNKVIRALRRGIDVNTRTQDTPILVRAAHHQHLEIVKLLLEQPDINVNAQQGEDGATPLIKALRSIRFNRDKAIEIIKLLLKDPRNVVSINTVYSTALNAAKHNKAPQEIIDLIRIRQEEEEKKKNIAMTRLVTEKANREDGSDLVPVAKRDVAASISRFFGGKRKTRKNHRKKK